MIACLCSSHGVVVGAHYDLVEAQQVIRKAVEIKDERVQRSGEEGQRPVHVVPELRHLELQAWKARQKYAT